MEILGCRDTHRATQLLRARCAEGPRDNKETARQQVISSVVMTPTSSRQRNTSCSCLDTCDFCPACSVVHTTHLSQSTQLQQLSIEQRTWSFRTQHNQTALHSHVAQIELHQTAAGHLQPLFSVPAQKQHSYAHRGGLGRAAFSAV